MEPRGLLHLATEPTKFALLEQLRAGERTVTQLVEAIGAEQSNVSHQLRALRDAGLVRGRRVGRERHYRISGPDATALWERILAAAADLERTAFYASLDLPTGPDFHGYG